jgi:hypothetical protein
VLILFYFPHHYRFPTVELSSDGYNKYTYNCNQRIIRLIWIPCSLIRIRDSPRFLWLHSCVYCNHMTMITLIETCSGVRNKHFVSRSRARLSPLGTSATIWLIVSAGWWMTMIMMSIEQSVECELAGEIEVLGWTLPQCYFVHHKSHMTWPLSRTWAADVASQRLTAWAIALTFVTHKVLCWRPC